MNTKNKKIILIHGLSQKPAKEALLKSWTKCLRANVKKDFQEGLIDIAYWANCLSGHIESVESRRSKKALEELLLFKEQKQNFHVGKGSAVSGFFSKKGVELLDILSSALTFKDNIINSVLNEIDVYVSQQYVADKIRNTLVELIIKAWNENKSIMIIGHSMGSFIAYDVLWSLSHRSQYKKYFDKKIEYFITMGSPLGDEYIKDILLCENFDNQQKKYYPANIESWYNFSAVGDVVCHDKSLRDDYMSKMLDLGVLSDFRDYVNLYNPYRIENHPNPHKSHGYLVQPKFEKVLKKFLELE